MKKTFFKNLFRDISKTLSRFLSIVIIIAVGVAFYVGVRATSPDMKKSADHYFSRTNFMDYKLVSTLGFTEDKVSKIKKIKDIASVEGSKSIDAIVEKDKQSLVININSLPTSNGINKIVMVNGRKPSNNNEAVVEDKFLKENKYKIGDEIVIKSGNDTSISDSLKNNKFKIVGTAKSPLYISAQRQLSSVGDGVVRGFVYVFPSVFKNDIYTEVYVKTNKSEASRSLVDNSDYKDIMASVESRLKGVCFQINKERYREVAQSAYNKVNEARNKLSNSKKETADKFTDARKKLTDAKDKLAQGQEEYNKNLNAFNIKMGDAEKQITDAKQQIKAGENEIELKTKEIQDGEAKIALNLSKLDESENEIKEGKVNAASSISNAMLLKVEQLKKQFEANEDNLVYKMEYIEINKIYEGDIKGKDFDTIYKLLKGDGGIDKLKTYFDIETQKNNFDAVENNILLGRSEVSNSKALLEEGDSRLQTTTKEIESKKKEIENAEFTLNTKRQDGIRQLNDAKKKLDDGRVKLQSNEEKLNLEEARAKEQFNAAEKEIQRNRDKIDDIKKPDYYVLGRNQNVGYESYRQDSARIDNIGKVFPLIFFLVAALVSLTTMTRMVQENRIEIGTFKALGYSQKTIISHYLIYSLVASIIGTILGVAIGFRLFPPLIINAYGSLYSVPDSITPFNVTLALQASVIAIFFTTIAAVASTIEELREVPASLMRPKPPKSGNIIFLEKITFIWKKLKFTSKVSARNIFRYKQRFFMTVIGIAACTGLMITGFGLKSGIWGATTKQFNTIYKYDFESNLKNNIDNDKKYGISNKFTKDSNVRSILFKYLKNGTVNNKNSSSTDVYIVVPESKSELNNYVDLIRKNKELKLEDNGAIVTQKLLKLTGKKIGDILDVKIDGKALKVKIAAVTEHYIYHYIYLSPEYYRKISKEKLEFNSFYGLLKDNSKKAENSTLKKLSNVSKVGSVSFKNNTRLDADKSIKSIDSVVLILIASAGVLAFVVIYNLTNININERKRELATIKLLGFYDNELAAYIYRENIILTIIGSLAGIIFGIVINNFVASTAETDVMMFLRTIKPIYFLYSILLTIAFSIIVNLAMYNRFEKIDMVESLKSAE